MNYIWTIVLGFILSNLIWFVSIINTNNYDQVSPRYISNSFDKDQNPNEVDSVLLKSLKKYIGKYFNEKSKLDIYEGKQIILENNVDIKENVSINENIISEKIKNFMPLKITNSSKISMFIDNENKFIYILKISNERESAHKFEGLVGEVELHYIPVENLINNSDNFDINNFENSFIKKCWNSKFNGRIFGAVSSNDKTSLSIFYRTVIGNTINYRIRFFHNISCNSVEINKSDEFMEERNLNFIRSPKNQTKTESTNESDSEPYYEISESQKSNEILHLKNYFNDQSYDDFSLKGNIPISAMAIKSNVLAYSRDIDYRQFYILRREKDEKTKKVAWKVSFMGPKNDKRQFSYFHSRSLKFANDDVHDYKMLHVALTANSTGVMTYAFLFKANHSQFTEVNNSFNFSEVHYLFTPLIAFSHNNEILFDNSKETFENFNIDNSFEKLKKLMKPTIYSNSNHDSLFFELTKGHLSHLNWDKKDENDYINSFSPENLEKINKISTDENTTNIIIKFENSNSLMYLNKYHESDDNIYFDVYKNVNFRYLPKKYHNNEIITFFLQTIKDKL